MVIYGEKKKHLLATAKSRLTESSAQRSFEKKMFFTEYLRVEMQAGDRSYILSGCIMSVIPSWGTGVPLSRLECLGKERQEEATKITQGCKNGIFIKSKLQIGAENQVALLSQTLLKLQMQALLCFQGT